MALLVHVDDHYEWSAAIHSSAQKINVLHNYLLTICRKYHANQSLPHSHKFAFASLSSFHDRDSNVNPHVSGLDSTHVLVHVHVLHVRTVRAASSKCACCYHYMYRAISKYHGNYKVTSVQKQSCVIANELPRTLLFKVSPHHIMYSHGTWYIVLCPSLRLTLRNSLLTCACV